MKKVQTKNKLKGFFGLFATLALAIGVGVSLAPREVVKTEAADQIITLNNIGVGTTDSDNVKQTTVNGYVLNYKKGKEQKNGSNTGMFLTKSAGAFVGNKTPIPGHIKSVELDILTGASGKTNYHVHFASTEFTAPGSGGTSVNITGGNSHTFNNPNNAGDIYFAVSLGNANNGQVHNIIVTYEDTPPVSVGSVTVSPDEDSIFVGETTQLTANVSPEGAPDGVTWSSDDEEVATVSASGLVTGVGDGTATISATSTSDNTKKGEATIHVSPVNVTSVSLSKDSVELYEGKTEQLSATVLPANATNKSVTWSSQNTDVVTVNNGLLTAVGAGNTTVTVTTVDGAKEDVATVSVLANPVTTLIVNHASVQKTYSLGEEFDGFAGLVVKERRANGDETTISDYDISTIDTMELGKQTVRVQKGDLHEEFVINVTNEGAEVGSINTPGTTYKETFSSFLSAGGNDNSYLQRTTNGSNGQVFIITDARIDGALTIRDGSMTTQFQDGLSELVFEYRKNFSDDDAYFEVHINGSKVGATVNVANNQGLTTFTLDNLTYKGIVDLEIKVANRVAFTYLDWTTAGILVDGMSFETQAKAFARFVGRAVVSGVDDKLLPKSLGPATLEAPTWEEIEEEKGAMDPEALVVFETSEDPEIVAGREVYEELYEENHEGYADASAFNTYIMGLTSEGNVSTVDCLANFSLAKDEWNTLSEEAKEAFLDTNNSAFAEGRSRLYHWAYVNGWELDVTTLQQRTLGGDVVSRENGNNSIATTLIIGVIGLTTLAGYYFLQKKKEA